MSCKPRSPRARASWQRGQSSVEYVVVCGALALVLGIGMVDDTSVLRQLLQALGVAYQKFSHAMSLPG